MLPFSLLFQAIVYGDAYHYPSSSQVSNIVLSTRPLSPGRKLPRLRPFSVGLTQAIMNRSLPAPPKRYDLVESFDALALAGKKPTENKLPAPPGPDHQSTFVGGLSPELLALNAALDNHRRPLVPPPSAVNRNARTALPPEANPLPVPPSKQIPVPIPMHAPQAQAGKRSLTMQYALKFLRRDTPTKPTLAPPFVTVPPRPHSDSIVPPKAASKPPLSAVPGPTQPLLNVTPSRPRAVSVPPSPTTSPPGKNTTRCSGMTKAGKQCSRQVKLPATHSHLDPTPVLYCHQHKEVMISAQTGFYVRKAGNADRFVEFSRMPTLEVKKGDGRLISFRRLYT